MKWAGKSITGNVSGANRYSGPAGFDRQPLLLKYFVASSDVFGYPMAVTFAPALKV